MIMASLSERLCESADDYFFKLANHPIIQAVSQPICNGNKMIYCRMYKITLETIINFLEIYFRAAKVLAISLDDRIYLVWMGRRFDLWLSQLQHEFQQLFGELSDELISEPLCDARVKQLKAMDHLIYKEEGLQFLVSIYGLMSMMKIFITNCPHEIRQIFTYKNVDIFIKVIAVMKDRIDTMSNEQSIDEQYYRRLEKLFTDFIKLDVRTYNYGYCGREYVTL